jgi:hypothetical protein
VARVVIFEFDSATWDVMTPMMEAGDLPNLSALKAAGASGVLRSISPMSSPALWTSIYTGKDRDKHKVYGFEATSASVRVKRLWDIAHQSGLTCGLFGTLVTWPPTDTCAFMLPDTLMARGSETMPIEYSRLQEMYWGKRQRKLNYLFDFYRMWWMGVRISHLLRIGGRRLVLAAQRSPNLEKYWRQTLWWARIHGDVFLRLYRQYQPELATFHYHATDTLQHRYWHYFAPEYFEVAPVEAERYRDVIPASYLQADQLIGELRRAVAPDTTLVVISDHGGCPQKETGQFIEARLGKWVSILGIRHTVTPMRLTDEHCLHFHDTSFLASARQTLEQVYVKESGQLLFRGFTQRDASLLFHPTRKDVEGDTVVIAGYGEYPFDELFQHLGAESSGMHHPDGIFIIAGPPIRSGVELEAGSILDVAPNVLNVLGLPVARDMDGRIWEQMFEPAFLAQFPIKFVETYETSEVDDSAPGYLTPEEVDLMYERLRALGYL